MDIKAHTAPDKLVRYSFLWSEIRLVLAAIALLLGGVPLVFFIVPIPFLFVLVRALLTISWIISGLSALYLVYTWNIRGRKIFGGEEKKDQFAFWVSVISGINLGIVGISETNIGMSITGNKLVFTITAIIYILTAVHLYRRFKENGEKIF